MVGMRQKPKLEEVPCTYESGKVALFLRPAGLSIGHKPVVKPRLVIHEWWSCERGIAGGDVDPDTLSRVLSHVRVDYDAVK